MNISTLKTITFNGTAVEKLYYNNVLVWQKQSVTPPSEIFNVVLFQSSDDPLYITTNEILGAFMQSAGGKFSFELENGETLGSEFDVVDMLIMESDAIQYSWSRLELFNEYAGDYGVLQLPFFTPSREALRDYLDDTSGRDMRGVIENAGLGLEFLAMYPGEQYVVACTRELQTLEDFRGMKFAYPSGNKTLWKNLLACFGASETVVSKNELYSALQTGVVDGAICTWENYVNMSLSEVVPYVSKLSAWNIKCFVTNAISMSKFSAGENTEFRETLNGGISLYYDTSEQTWLELEERMVAEGVTIYEFDSSQVEDIRAALEPIYIEYQQLYPDWYSTVDDFMNGYR